MVATEEAAAGRQRRGMHRFEDQVFGRVNQDLLGDSEVAPEDEDEMFALLRQGAYGGIGELLPTVVRVRGGLTSAHRQRGVEQ